MTIGPKDLDTLDHNHIKREKKTPENSSNSKASRASFGVFMAALIAIWGINQFFPCFGPIGTLVLVIIFWLQKRK